MVVLAPDLAEALSAARNVDSAVRAVSEVDGRNVRRAVDRGIDGLREGQCHEGWKKLTATEPFQARLQATVVVPDTMLANLVMGDHAGRDRDRLAGFDR